MKEVERAMKIRCKKAKLKHGKGLVEYDRLICWKNRVDQTKKEGNYNNLDKRNVEAENNWRGN